MPWGGSAPADDRASGLAPWADSLVDLVEQSLYSWTDSRRDSLVSSYNLHSSLGQGPKHAAETVLKKCIAIIKDRKEATREKLNAIRVLDACMELQNCALGLAMVPQLKFFSQIAKKAKEKNEKYRRPTGVFAPKVSKEEVADFMNAVCELLDKWGRRFKEQDMFQSMPSLEEWNKVRRDQVLNYIALPSPDKYRWVEPVPLSMESTGIPTGTTAAPPRTDGLDESVIDTLVSEVRTCHARHGAQDMRTADARARCESELRRWQDAAQALSERDDMDFAEFQRLSDVAHRNAALLENLSSAPEGGGASPRSPRMQESASQESIKSPASGQSFASPWAAQKSGTQESIESADGTSGRRRRRNRKKSPDAFGQDGATEQDTTAWANAGHGSPSMSGFAPVNDEWAGQAGAPANEFGVPAAAGFGPATGQWTGQAGGDIGFAPTAQPADVGWAAQPGSMDQAEGGWNAQPGSLDPGAYGTGAHEPGYGPADDAWSQSGGVRHGDGKIPRLQAQVTKLRMMIAQRMAPSSMENQLEQSYRRVRDLEAMQSLIHNASHSLDSVDDINVKLRDEVNKSREDLREARRRLLQAEDALQRKEDLISDARQQLFKMTHRAVQLEDELRERGQAHEALHGKLQEKRVSHSSTELQLRRAQHAFNSASGVMNRSEAGSNPFRTGTSPTEGEAPLQSLARSQRAGQSIASARGAGALTSESQAVIRQTPSDVWAQTPHASASQEPVVLRVPPGRPEWIAQAKLHFQSLLAQRRGMLYEDDRIAVEMSFPPSIPSMSSSRPVIAFELAISNQAAHPLHDLNLQAQNNDAAPFQLRIQSKPGTSGAGVIWPRQQAKYWGEVEIADVFEAWPHAVLSYLLSDNLFCRLRLRLPLTIMRLMSPARLSKEQFMSLWSSAELAHHEVAFVCSVRSDLFGVGAPFSWAKCLEFSGALHHIPGLDESPGNVVLVGSFPQAQGNAVEVMVRAEISSQSGLPSVLQRASSQSSPQCRVAVRTASHSVGQAVAKVILELLSERQDS